MKRSSLFWIFIVIALLLPAVNGYSDSSLGGSEILRALPHIPPELSAELLDKGGVSRFYTSGEQALLGRDDIEPWDGYTIAAEAAYLITDYDRELGEIDLFNILRAVSSLEGIEYYSASRGEMRTLFIESYAIESPETRKRIPDPLVYSIPDSSSLFVYQRDKTFGKSVSELTYRRFPDSLGMSMRNLTVLTYGPVPVIGPEGLRMDIFIVPGDGWILFSGTMRIKAAGMFLLEDRLKRSVSNRIIALYEWFASSVR